MEGGRWKERKIVQSNALPLVLKTTTALNGTKKDESSGSQSALSTVLGDYSLMLW